MSDTPMLRVMLPTSLRTIAEGLHLNECLLEWCVLLDPVAVLATEAYLWSMNDDRWTFAGHVSVPTSTARLLREAAKDERVKEALARWSSGHNPVDHDGQLKPRAICLLIGLAILATLHTSASYYGTQATKRLRGARERAKPQP